MTPAPVGLRCPEHSGKPQGVKKVTAAAERAATGGGAPALPGDDDPDRDQRRRLPAELALGGTVDGTGNWIYDHGALFAPDYLNGSPGRRSNGGWWRLITSPFLHFGIIHLGLNMLALYWFGPLLERLIGSLRFLLLYLAAGLAGSAGALWLSPEQRHGRRLGGDLRRPRRAARARAAAHDHERRPDPRADRPQPPASPSTLPGISIGGHLGGLVAGDRR